MMRASLRPSRRWILIGVVASLGWTAGKVTVPLLAQRAVDRGIEPYDGGALLAWAVAIVAVTLLIMAGTGVRRYAAFAISLRSETDLRRTMYAHLQRLHFAYHDEAQTGQLMSRAQADLRQIQLLLVFIPVTGANLVMIISVAAVLVAINAKLALAALAALPFLNVAATRFSRRLHPEAAGLQQCLADVANVVEEGISGIRVLKGFGAEELQTARLRETAAAVRRQALRVARLRSTFTPLMELLPMFGLIAVLYVGGREVLAGRLTVGELIAFNFYVLQLVFPLRLTAFLVANASRASAAAARVYEVLSTAPEITDRPKAGPLPEGPGETRFAGVQFEYVPGTPVLEDFDLVIRGSESVALVGATGSGKSTVARLVPRFYDVQAGRVTLDGADLRDVRLADLRRAVGIVFEETFLFSDTVRANIAFADPQAPIERIIRAARSAGAHDFIASMPAGYDTVIGERGFSLSGGQRQRLAIARAILAGPRVLLLDDATSSVDPTKEHEIRAALQAVMRGRTTLIIAHRPATAALADRVVLLRHGRVVAAGTHAELLGSSAEYREVLAHAESHEDERTSPAPGPSGATT